MLLALAAPSLGRPRPTPDAAQLQVALERLNELTKMPDVMNEAERVIQRALKDQSFEVFRKDADAALGR